MAITVGLDFGTHQTKICIEDSNDIYHKTYEFFEWETGVVALPSTIQINMDHTLSYGKIDLENCLIGRKRKLYPKPKDLSFSLPDMPEKPEYYAGFAKKPQMPSVKVTVDGCLKEIPYSELFGIGRILRKKTDYPEYVEWVDTCNLIDDYYDVLHDAWVRIMDLSPDYNMPEPELPPLPEEPYLDGYVDVDDPNLIASEAQIEEFKRWQCVCKKLDELDAREKIRFDKAWKKYENDLALWEDSCSRIRSFHETQQRLYERSKESLPMVFRYFKQAVFSSYNWTYEISARDLSVLYLANIIFKLEERFGTQFSIQMGIPASADNYKNMKEYASGLLIQAYRIVENVFENDYEKFLVTPYEELLSLIPTYEYSEELKEEYGILIFPEAYAALRSLTKRSKIPNGMSVMLDIGGGTTDISFFVIEMDGEPHVYDFASIAKGLNFFIEYGNVVGVTDFTEKKNLEDLDPEVVERAYIDYKANIDRVVGEITKFLHRDTISRGFNKKAFKNAIQNRPAVYSGGGSFYERLRQEILDFTDVKHINRQSLAIANVVNEKSVNIPYSVLATAYGLAIRMLHDDIEISKKEDLFAKYTNVDEREDRMRAHREHGMYED